MNRVPGSSGGRGERGERRASARAGAAEPLHERGKPRLLYVSTFFPYPANGGGKLRVSNLLPRLSDAYEIHYLCLGSDDEQPSPAALAQAESFCKSVTVIPHKLNRVRAALKVLLTLSPYEVNHYDNPEFAAVLRRLTASLRPDVLWFSRLAAGRYLGDKEAAMAVLDQHDLSSQIWHLMRHGAPQAWVRLFAAINGHLVERYERNVYPSFDVSVSVSEAERLLTRQRVLRGAERPVLITAPNGVDIEFYTPGDQSHQASPRDLVLTGTMNQRRNVDAAIYFATEIFPSLAAQFEDLRFVIVGRDPARDVLELRRIPGVLVTGAVPDVRPYLERAQVVVAPFRFGSGVKHKVPIAMAMAKAIVSSSNGIQGLDVVHGQHVMVADTPADFVANVAVLLRDHQLREALGIRAHQLAVERYSWNHIVSKLVQEIEAVRLSRGRQAVPVSEAVVRCGPGGVS